MPIRKYSEGGRERGGRARGEERGEKEDNKEEEYLIVLKCKRIFSNSSLVCGMVPLHPSLAILFSSLVSSIINLILRLSNFSVLMGAG
jgi:hypothetical protein